MKKDFSMKVVAFHEVKPIDLDVVRGGASGKGTCCDRNASDCNLFSCMCYNVVCFDNDPVSCPQFQQV